MKLFPFAGEGVTIKAVIGNIKQEDMSPELADTIVQEDLTSLQMQKAAFTRLQECIDFLDILTASDGDTCFGTYCAEALNLNEEELADFGGSNGSVRTAVKLKHLRSLFLTLQDVLIDPVAQIAPPYQTPLSAGQEQRLRQAASDIEDPQKGGNVGNLKTLIKTYKKLLVDKHQEFVEPCPPRTGQSDAEAMMEAVPLYSNGMWCGYLEFAEIPGMLQEDGTTAVTLLDMPWFENFPSQWLDPAAAGDQAEMAQMMIDDGYGEVNGLSTMHLKAAYQLLCRIEQENQVGTTKKKFHEKSVNAKANFWEEMMAKRQGNATHA